MAAHQPLKSPPCPLDCNDLVAMSNCTQGLGAKKPQPLGTPKLRQLHHKPDFNISSGDHCAMNADKPPTRPPPARHFVSALDHPHDDAVVGGSHTVVGPMRHPV